MGDPDKKLGIEKSDSGGGCSVPNDAGTAGYRMVRWLLAAILLVSAGLKTHELLTGPVAQTVLPNSPWFHVAVIESELLLGLWLSAGIYPRAAWSIALAAFSVLASASLYLAVVVQAPSCDCFGRLSINPWYTLALDSAAVLALVRWRPSGAASGSFVPREAIATGAGAAVILGVMFGTLTWLYGSPYEGLVHLRNETLTVEPRIADVGAVRRGEPTYFTITAHNHGDRAIRIVGGSADCSCIATDDLPIEVAPRTARSLRIRLEYKGRPGVLRRPFNLYYADGVAQSVVSAWLSARVVEVPGS